MPGRPKNEKKRLDKLSAPANEDEIREYREACQAADIEPADTLRKLAKSLVLHVKQHGSVTFPIRFATPDKKH